MARQNLSGRAASMARRQQQVNGKRSVNQAESRTRNARDIRSSEKSERVQTLSTAPTTTATPSTTISSASNIPRKAPSRAATNSPARGASLARRQAQSAKGKAGVRSADRQRTQEMIRTRSSSIDAKASDCDCGCKGSGESNSSVSEVKPSIRPQSSTPSRRKEARVYTSNNAGRINSRMRREALSRQGKTGADNFRRGLSSAQIVRHQNPDISGRELARSVREMRSSNGARGKSASAPTGRVRSTCAAERVTGTRVLHSKKTTGDETGLCRSVTGTDYMSGEVFTEFCQTEGPVVPAKVQLTNTSSGNMVTSGGKVGSSEKVTGDERGNCRSITGTEYLGSEHFKTFCNKDIQPGSAKVSFSKTSRGQIISGSKPARSSRVTGDEPGTCKAITGTPYAGVEQFETYCNPDATRLAQARSARNMGSNVGREISGIQPGLRNLTGAEKGACEVVSGTPYIGAIEQQEVCGVSAAKMTDGDYPQFIGEAPWGQFSVVDSPVHASQIGSIDASRVTGSQYEQGRISGTFSLGEGKVTGTEQFRFGDKSKASLTSGVLSQPEEPVQRVTGEGIETGLKITGDDWDRGDRVTGTEGMSATKRNPTRKGPINAMPAVALKRNEEVEASTSRVTGSSGNTEKGAPITVSGGARG